MESGVCFFGLDQTQLMVINKVKMLSGLEFILYCSQSTFCADCKNVPERYYYSINLGISNSLTHVPLTYNTT